jgi:hypothetical protein
MSTPINRVQNDGASSHGAELIDNVLNAIDKTVEHKSEGGSVHQASENGEVQHMDEQHMDEQSMNSSNTESSNGELINRAMKSGPKSKDMVSSIEADEHAEKIIENLIKKQNSKKSYFQRLMDELKDPFMVMVFLVLFQSKAAQNLLTTIASKVIPARLGEYALPGMIIKAILFSIVYYVMKFLLA